MQRSDVTLEQLNQMYQRRATLGFNPLQGKPWFFAHSQGVCDAVITDHRLKELGFDGLGKIVATGAAVKGGRLLGTPFGDGFITGAEDAAATQGRDALAALDHPITTADLILALDIHGANRKAKLENRLRRTIDFAFGGIVAPSQPQGNVRGAFLFLAQQPDYLSVVTPNDGVENVDSTTLGRHSRTFAQADHILMIEDPAILHAELQEIRDH